MNCLKCGRETMGEQVFCEDCQIEMAKYPVRPGTVVQLPHRKESNILLKASKKRVVPLEDQVKHLRTVVRNLVVALLIVTGIAIALAYPAVEHLMESHFKIGQNYTAMPQTETESTN